MLNCRAALGVWRNCGERIGDDQFGSPSRRFRSPSRPSTPSRCGRWGSSTLPATTVMHSRHAAVVLPPRLDDGSRMSREVPVRFCEGPGGATPPAYSPLHQGPRQVELSLSGRRQARQNGGFSASSGSRYRRCTGILPQSTVQVFTAVAAQDNARRL
jgi:hypothetical protein